jgi:hypothetical protein
VALIVHQGGAYYTVAPPADWTAIPNTDNCVYSSSSSGCDGSPLPTGTRVRGFYKAATASETGPYDFLLTSSDTADILGTVLAVSGVDVSRPIQASGVRVNPPNFICAGPALSVAANAGVLFVCGVELGSGSASAMPFAELSAGMVERSALQSMGAYRSAEETASGTQATAGGRAVQVTLPIAAANLAALVALNPAPAP